MNTSAALTVQKRTAQGKQVAGLRRQGYVPGVVYGQSFAATMVQAPLAELQKTVRQAGRHHPVELDLDGDKRLAMIKTIDLAPVKQNIRHIAFHVIKQNEKVATEVPVVITGEGETPAEKAGLVLLKTADTVGIEALPAHLPNNLTANGDGLTAEGDRLTVADITPPPNVTITSDPDTVLVTVYEPAALVAANDALAGEPEAEADEVKAENGGDESQDSQSPTPQ